MIEPPPAVTDRPPPLDDLVGLLKPILRKGLPVTPRLAPDPLLALRGVWARSIDPDDRLYRVRGLDRLLREMIEAIRNDQSLGLAARVLFGLAEGTAGTNLTQRRARVAKELVLDAEHVRKHVEPQVLERVAWLIHQDSQTYTPRSRGLPPPIAVSGDTPQITAEDLQSEERLQHEELLSRLWAEVYHLRAALLAVRRRIDYPDDHEGADYLGRARQEALQSRSDLQGLIDRYIEQYGERIAHGEAEFDVRRLVRLAGWSE